MGKLTRMAALLSLMLAGACAPTTGGTQQRETPPAEQVQPRDGAPACRKPSGRPPVQGRAFYFFPQSKKKHPCNTVPER